MCRSVSSLKWLCRVNSALHLTDRFSRFRSRLENLSHFVVAIVAVNLLLDYILTFEKSYVQIIHKKTLMPVHAMSWMIIFFFVRICGESGAMNGERYDDPFGSLLIWINLSGRRKTSFWPEISSVNLVKHFKIIALNSWSQLFYLVVSSQLKKIVT